MKKVAIIIVNFNGEKYLPDCLGSLQKINYDKDFFKIIIVDNDSEDRSLEIIEKFSDLEIKLIKNDKNQGFAEGNNIGIRWAMGENFNYVYLLNQDTAVEPDFLVKAVELAESDSKISAVQSLLLLWSEKDKINSWGNEIHYLGFGFSGGYKEKFEKEKLAEKEINYASGAGCLLKINVLKEIGLFDSDLFMYHEDLDLGWRMKIAGYKNMLAPKSIVYHKYEFSKSIEKFYYMERNRYIVLLKNYKWATLFLISLAVDFMEIGMLVFSFFNGTYKERFKVYKYIFNAKNLDRIFDKREEVQKLRKVSDRTVSKNFVGSIEFQDLQNAILKYIVNPLFSAYWFIVKQIILW